MYYINEFPRPYEFIWTEQAYISSHIERHTSRLRQCRLKMEWAEQQISSGLGQSRRRMKKLVSMLKTTYDRDEQAQAQLYARLAELSIELSWRQALGQEQGSEPTRLNAESPEFVPQSHEIYTRLELKSPEQLVERLEPDCDQVAEEDVAVVPNNKRWSAPYLKPQWPE